MKPSPSPTSVPELYAVLQLVRPLHRVAAQVVADGLVGTGITVGGRAILARLHQDGAQPVPQIAHTLTLPRQAIQRCVNDLLALGLVTTAPNPMHRRSHLIRLTEEGARRLTSLRDDEDAYLAELASTLPAEDTDAAVRVLTALIAHLRRRIDAAEAAGSAAENQAEAVDRDAHAWGRS